MLKAVVRTSTDLWIVLKALNLQFWNIQIYWNYNFQFILLEATPDYASFSYKKDFIRDKVPLFRFSFFLFKTMFNMLYARCGGSDCFLASFCWQYRSSYITFMSKWLFRTGDIFCILFCMLKITLELFSELYICVKSLEWIESQKTLVCSQQ